LALHRFDLDKLVRNVDLLDVSLNSVDPATYHKIMGVNKLDVVLKNLRLLKKAIDSVKQKRKKAVRVAVRFIEGEYNAGQWSAFKELVEEDIGFPAFRKVVHSFKNILGKGDTKAKNKAKRCNQPFRHINFNVRGDMVSCCLDWDVENIFGNIREHTIKKMWESEGFERWRKNRLSTTCKKCLGV
jgi:MoaA/NifB/PqqE/SkfB family radical SAM enzyme